MVLFPFCFYIVAGCGCGCCFLFSFFFVLFCLVGCLVGLLVCCCCVVVVLLFQKIFCLSFSFLIFFFFLSFCFFIFFFVIGGQSGENTRQEKTIRDNTDQQVGQTTKTLICAVLVCTAQTPRNCMCDQFAASI